jgi:glycerol uptake facilitator-like aquaporin
MPDLSTLLLVIYGIGALIALIRTDAGPGTRLGLAAVWPIGPVAFVLTVGGLLLAALVPLSGLATRRSRDAR